MFHYYTRTKESRKVRNTRMLDLKLINKVNEVEKQTGQSLPSLLSKVPLGNVLTALKELQIADLVEMVSSVPISKLTHGLTIITPDEISQISPEKLKIVLKTWKHA